MTDEELIAMARLAQRDDRMSTGALYGDLADRIEAQAAEIERLRGEVARLRNAAAVVVVIHREARDFGAFRSTKFTTSLSLAVSDLKEALTGSATVKDSLTTEDEKQSHEWKCPIDYPGCRKNCGSYGCGN